MDMECFIGTILAWAPNFAPRGWLLCDGRELSIKENMALFTVIGNKYGGNGFTTFALPNLCGRVMMGARDSSAPGKAGGVEEVRLTSDQIPSHNHHLNANTNKAVEGSNDPDETRGFGLSGAGFNAEKMYNKYSGNATDLVELNPMTITDTGLGEAHSNLQPYQALHYIICYDGYFPRRDMK